MLEIRSITLYVIIQVDESFVLFFKCSSTCIMTYDVCAYVLGTLKNLSTFCTLSTVMCHFVPQKKKEKNLRMIFARY